MILDVTMSRQLYRGKLALVLIRIDGLGVQDPKFETSNVP